MLRKDTASCRIKSSEIGISDWIMVAVCAIACYLLFGQEDVATTSFHALSYLNGHITDFYTACHDSTGFWGANYLPSTFIAFAIWLIPLKLFGLDPTQYGDFRMIQLYWFKLFPIVIFLLSSFLFHKICRERLGFSQSKARISLYLFITFPAAFFTQFITVHYDILQVFFVLLGLWYYLGEEYDIKKKLSIKTLLKFSICFGVAATFKYFSLVIFAILLVLREKRLKNIIVGILVAVFPIAFEFGFYYVFDRAAFLEHQINFAPLSFGAVSSIFTGIASVQLLPFALLMLVFWSYFLKPSDNREFICYVFYLCSLVCAALFVLMKWHPQWLMLGVPFWVIGTVINKRFDIFLWLDMIFTACFYIVVVNHFSNNCDQKMLLHGLFRPLLVNKDLTNALHMADIYKYNNLDILISIIAVVFICNAIFKHPKYCMDNITDELNKDDMSTEFASPAIISRIRFGVVVLMFALPALMCLPSLTQQPSFIWDSAVSADNVVFLNSKNSVKQYVTFGGNTLSSIRLITATNDKELVNQELIVEVIDPNNNEIVASSSLSAVDISNNTYSTVYFDNVSLTKGKQYIFAFSERYNDIDEDIAIYYGDVTPAIYHPAIVQNYDNDKLVLSGSVEEGSMLLMRATGRP